MYVITNTNAMYQYWNCINSFSIIPSIHVLNFPTFMINCSFHTILAKCGFVTSGIQYVAQKMQNSINQGILKGELGLFLTPVLTLWGSGHFDHHVWRWAIVPSDLAWTFGAICAHYRYRVIHRAITIMRAWFKSTRERQLTLAWRP